MYNDDTEQHPKIEPTTPAYPPVPYPVYSDMRQRTSPHDYPNIPPPPPRKRNGRRWLILSILAFLCLGIILAGIWLTDYNLRRADTAVPTLTPTQNIVIPTAYTTPTSIPTVAPTTVPQAETIFQDFKNAGISMSNDNNSEVVYAPYQPEDGSIAFIDNTSSTIMLIATFSNSGEATADAQQTNYDTLHSQDGPGPNAVSYGVCLFQYMRTDISSSELQSYFNVMQQNC